MEGVGWGGLFYTPRSSLYAPAVGWHRESFWCLLASVTQWKAFSALINVVKNLCFSISVYCWSGEGHGWLTSGVWLMELAVPVVKHLFADEEDVVRLKEFERNTRKKKKGGGYSITYSIKEGKLTSFVCSFSYTFKFYNVSPDFVWSLWNMLWLPRFGCRNT